MCRNMKSHSTVLDENKHLNDLQQRNLNITKKIWHMSHRQGKERSGGSKKKAAEVKKQKCRTKEKLLWQEVW